MEACALHPETQIATEVRRLPWLGLLWLTLMFFAIGHDPLHALKVHHVGPYEHYLQDEGRVEEDAAANLREGSLKRQLGFLGVGLFGLLVLARRGRSFLRFRGLQAGLTLFFVSWSFLSLMWSADPALTAKKLSALGLFWVGILAVMSMGLTVSQVIRFVFFSTGTYLLIGLFSEVALGTFHPLAAGYQFAGTLHPNAQGINCGLFLISGIFLLKETRRPRLVLAAVVSALVFLLLTKSRTSVFGALGAIGVTWLLSSSTTTRTILVLNITLCATLLLALFGQSIIPGLRDTALLGRNPADLDSLTGRLPLWNQCLEFAARHPFLGYGYDSFWTPHRAGYIAWNQGWNVTEAHSTYLDTLLGLGLVGLISYVLMMLGGIIKAIRFSRTTGNDKYGCFAAILAFALIDGFSESAVLNPVYFSFAIFYVLAYLSIDSRLMIPDSCCGADLAMRNGS